MTSRRLLPISILGAFAAILVVVLLVDRSNTLRAVDHATDDLARLESPGGQVVPAGSLGTPPEIMQSGGEVASPQRMDGPAAGKFKPSPALEEIALKLVRLDGINRNRARLIDAGYSPELAEQLTRHADELWLERDRKEKERRENGLPPDKFLAAYTLDMDLDLREEIGGEEFDRYRIAIGKPIAVVVDEVRADSSAQAIGLAKGDEIVSYAGKRVYNYPQLFALADVEANSGAPVSIEVRRNGQLVNLSLPAGPIGVVNPSFWSKGPRRQAK